MTLHKQDKRAIKSEQEHYFDKRFKEYNYPFTNTIQLIVDASFFIGVEPK